MATLTGSNFTAQETYGAWTNPTNANGAADNVLAVSPSNVSDSTEAVTWDITGSAIAQTSGTTMAIRCKYATGGVGIGAIVTCSLQDAAAGGGSQIASIVMNDAMSLSLTDMDVDLTGLSLAQLQSIRSAVFSLVDSEGAGDVTISIDSLTITYTEASTSNTTQTAGRVNAAALMTSDSVLIPKKWYT